MRPQLISQLESWKNYTFVLCWCWTGKLVWGKGKSDFFFLSTFFPSPVIGSLLGASWDIKEGVNNGVFYSVWLLQGCKWLHWLHATRFFNQASMDCIIKSSPKLQEPHFKAVC